MARRWRAYPSLRFDEGSMLALDLPEATLTGVVHASLLREPGGERTQRAYLLARKLSTSPEAVNWPRSREIRG